MLCQCERAGCADDTGCLNSTGVLVFTVHGPYYVCYSCHDRHPIPAEYLTFPPVDEMAPDGHEPGGPSVLRQFEGTFLGVTGAGESAVLWWAPQNADGTADIENIGEVTAIDSEDTAAYLDRVNGVFGTQFIVAQFDGR